MKLSNGDILKAAAQILFGIAIVAVIMFYSDKLSALQNYGYVGVFLVSLFTSATVLVPVPGWAVVIAMSATLNPYLVGIAAGLGSGLGEITGYIIGDGVMDITDPQHKKHIELVRKYGFAAVFVLAVIPNPLFDVAGIAAGAIRMPMWQFLLAAIAGRIIRFVLLAYFGAWALAQF
ncbi:SNARE associated Golgi protein [uncultured archaeon]|nr:SNARE associated Golgi protein [uncultured archaeon]